jgi:hypothetical protein
MPATADPVRSWGPTFLLAEDVVDEAAVEAAVPVGLLDVMVLFPVADAVPAVAVLAAAVEQTMALGTCTPCVLQKLTAKLMAVAWSAASQAEARQHAMSPRKLLCEQMHFASIWGQPPMLDPLVNWVTQLVWLFCQLAARSPPHRSMALV